MGRIGASKLNEEKVEIIKDLLKLGNNTHQQIADLFGVSRILITHINNGRRWNEDIREYQLKTPAKDKRVKNIIVFYDDGTYEELDV